MKVKDGAISRKQAVKALMGWDEEAKDEDIIFTLNELPNVPTIPLSVIEKIKKEITKDRDDCENCLDEADEEIAKILKTRIADMEWVLLVIDKAVKEIKDER